MSVDCWRRSPKGWPSDLADRQCELDAHASWTHHFSTDDGIYAWRDQPTATVLRDADVLEGLDK